MTPLTWVLTALSAVATVCSIIFGFAAFSRNRNHDVKEDGAQIAVILTKLGSIEGALEAINKRLDTRDSQYIEVVTRLTAVEASAKQAHHRLDRFEGKGDNR